MRTVKFQPAMEADTLPRSGSIAGV